MPRFKIIIDSSIKTINDNKTSVSFINFIEKIAYALGISKEHILILGSFDYIDNSFVFDCSAQENSTIDITAVDYVLYSVLTYIKIKLHLSPLCHFRILPQDNSKIILYNGYNKEEIFDKDIWCLYKNNLDIDLDFCKIIEHISTKQVSKIEFFADNDSVVLKGSKIFDTTLPFKEHVTDYFEEKKATLLIKKADFDCIGYWEFRVGGRIIKAKIHPSQRKKLSHIVNTCVLGGKCLSVSIALTCKLDAMGVCIKNTEKYEIVDIFGEPRDLTEHTELLFKIENDNEQKNYTQKEQLYLV